MLGIGKDRAYLDGFYKAKTMEDKVAVVDNYAMEHLDINMTADIDIVDGDRKYFPPHPMSLCQGSSTKSLMKARGIQNSLPRLYVPFLQQILLM